MRFVAIVLTFCLIFSGLAFAQLYQGPASGSVPGGISVSTNDFSTDSPEFPGPAARLIPNKIPWYPLADPANLPPPSAPEGSNYFEDPSLTSDAVIPPPITIASFGGIPQTNWIPPDPHMAAGPNHLMAVVNSTFRITDKQGNSIKTIFAENWYNSVLPSNGAFDPKVHYDHHAGRWIMVWLNLNQSAQTAYFLLSVSDDDDPVGTWYNWALPSHVNGSTPAGNWADYQGVGFDNQAIYITANQFQFGGSSQYVKLRIIAKAQLYANTAGPVTWTDLWDLQDPTAARAWGARPAVIHGAPNEAYLVSTSPFSTGTYMTVFKITNPITAPVMTAVNVPVTAWTSAPNANQLGGSTTLIEAGGSGMRNEPVYMDSAIWVTHSVRSGSGNQYSSVRYVRINTQTNSAIEDVAFGADGFWHFYPAIAVDRSKNIAITFSRSGLTEYVGAAMTWRLQSDAPGLRPTFVFQGGKSNYVRVASGRNRWGDYMGIALDPVDRNNFWLFTEYAGAGNSWATWFLGTRLVPFVGDRMSVSVSSLSFGKVETGSTSDTARVVIHSIGTDVLVVNSITKSNPSYAFVDLPSTPVGLPTYDSLAFGVVLQPTVHGIVHDTIVIVSQAGTHLIPLDGKGVEIGRARAGRLYAASGLPNSQLYSLNGTTGSATLVGPLGLGDIHGFAIRNSDKEILGIVSGSPSSMMYRISSEYGDALPYVSVPVANMRAIAFSPGDTLYGATTTGDVYTISLPSGNATLLGNTTSIVYSGLSIEPTTGTLWASVRPPISGRDRIYIVDRSSGGATLVGATGFGKVVSSIAFSAAGDFFGIDGIGSQVNNLLAISTATGVGTIVGSTGVMGLSALAARTDSLVTSVGQEVNPGIPKDFALGQNYPNPFNPVTLITYALPLQSRVTLRIYDIMGQEIALLIDGIQNAGHHSILWRGLTSSGQQAASGMYLYRLEAVSSDGKPFSSVKKMMLLK